MYGLGFTLASEGPSIVRTAGETYTEQIDPYGDYVGSTGAPGTKDLTWWINQNAGKVAIGALAFLGLVMFAKAGR